MAFIEINNDKFSSNGKWVKSAYGLTDILTNNCLVDKLSADLTRSARSIHPNILSEVGKKSHMLAFYEATCIYKLLTLQLINYKEFVLYSIIYDLLLALITFLHHFFRYV